MIKTLPHCWWITPDINSSKECDHLLKLLNQRVAEGIRHIQFRQTKLNLHEFEVVFHQVFDYCKMHGLTLIINGEAALAVKLHADGCYLNSDVLMNCLERPLSKDYWVGAYCHNLEELLHAEKIDLDFVSLSPVQKTLSHPEQIPMGWDNFEKLIQQITLPVYALGGMKLNDKDEAIARGGKGIMGIRF
ncbi:MAG: thiamine phosphate synthase [Gammaproteobacteria bacterium]|jgi:thiamine-phosphate diphosphorylase